MSWRMQPLRNAYKVGWDDAKAGYDCVSPWRNDGPQSQKRNELYLKGYLSGRIIYANT